MDNFWFFLDQGFFHVLDWKAYDHILFLIVLSIPYAITHWKKLLTLITLFTIGHTTSLALSAFDIVPVNSSIIEFLIPVTILVTAFVNIFYLRNNTNKRGFWIHGVTTLLFGIIHGFGFSTLFKMMTASATNKGTLLISYTLGIEFAQVVIVLVLLIVSFVVTSFFRVSLRDWALFVSAIIIGRVLSLLSDTWNALSI